MKLLKYFLFLMILSSSIYFLIELNELNEVDGIPIKIKIPFFDAASSMDGFNVWMVLVMTLTVGVIIGFILALFQIISQKSEVYSLKSKLRRVQIELDSLRNESLDDNIDLTDDNDDSYL